MSRDWEELQTLFRGVINGQLPWGTRNSEKESLRIQGWFGLRSLSLMRTQPAGLRARLEGKKHFH